MRWSPESNQLLGLRQGFLISGFPQKRPNYHTAFWQVDDLNWEEAKEIFRESVTPKLL